MLYKNYKIIHVFDNTINQHSKFRTNYWSEISDDSRGTYNTNSQIKFKTTILKPSLCDYSDTYLRNHICEWNQKLLDKEQTQQQ